MKEDRGKQAVCTAVDRAPPFCACLPATISYSACWLLIAELTNSFQVYLQLSTWYVQSLYQEG